MLSKIYKMLTREMNRAKRIHSLSLLSFLVFIPQIITADQNRLSHGKSFMSTLETKSSIRKKPINNFKSTKESDILATVKATSKATSSTSAQSKAKSSDPACECCVKIPFSLGNGLPATDPLAIPNSDGSFGPFIITTPGYYILQNSPQMQITNAPTNNPNVSIYIVSSDVYLDLCDMVLTGSGNLTAPFSPSFPPGSGGIVNDERVDANYGIFVNPNFEPFLDNITIANGKLQFYTEFGILATGITNFRLENLVIENIGSVTSLSDVAGCDVEVGSNITIDNVSQLNNYGRGAYFANLSNLQVTNFTNAGQRGHGISHAPSLFLNPDFVANGWLGWAIQIQNTENVLVENCIVSNVRTLASVYGIDIDTFCSGAVVRSCTVTDVSNVLSDLTVLGVLPSGLAEFGFEVRGIMVEVGTVGALVEDCTVQNIGSVIQKVYSIGSTYPVGNSVAAYNLQTDIGLVVRNSQASDIWSYGKITSLQPSIGLNQLVSDMPAVGFFREIQPNFQQGQGHNAVFTGCTATNINGGMNVSADMASPGWGFTVNNVNFIVSPDLTPVTMAQLFQNCSTQDVFGNSQSAGFSVNYRLPFAANGHSPLPVIFDGCSTQFDRINNPTGLSNGFITGARGNITVFKTCFAQGHTLNGFDLAGDTLDNSTGNGKMILDGCIANGNSGYGFRLDHTLKQAEINNCKSTNNGFDGFMDSPICRIAAF